jgi:hypothetical protein
MTQGPENPEVQKAFVDAILNHASALVTAVEYIGETLEPGDVFSDEKLTAWAKARGFQITEE